MIVRAIFLGLCVMGLLTQESHAQFFLENGKVTLAASGGEHFSGGLIIHNTSPDPATITVYWQDFEYKSPYDGSKNFLPAGTTPDSANQWVSFYPQTFSMPAFGQQRVQYTVSVPSSIEKGHYGVLFFERSAPAAQGDHEINLVTRVGCLFFIEPSNKIKKAVIQDIQLKGNTLTAGFVNQGNVILIPRTTYYVMQQGGLVLDRGEAKTLYVPAGASAPLEISLKKQFEPGRYSLVINSDLEDGDVSVKEIVLSVDASGQMTIENARD